MEDKHSEKRVFFFCLLFINLPFPQEKKQFKLTLKKGNITLRTRSLCNSHWRASASTFNRCRCGYTFVTIRVQYRDGPQNPKVDLIVHLSLLDGHCFCTDGIWAKAEWCALQQIKKKRKKERRLQPPWSLDTSGKRLPRLIKTARRQNISLTWRRIKTGSLTPFYE